MCLSSEQMERLSEFVRSPYFNKNRVVAFLFDYLKSHYPDFDDSSMTSEALRKNVKGITGANDLGRKLNRLLELTEEFLSLENNRNDFAERIGTLKAYKKLQLPKHFEFLAKQLRKEFEEKPFKDFDHRWLMHELEEELFEGFDKGLLRIPENSADKVMETLIRFYLTKKLCYVAEAVNRERVLGKIIAENDKNEMLDFLHSKKDDKDLYLALYGNIFKMNLEKSPEKAAIFYQELKKAVFSFPHFIPEDEIRNACGYLQNFCVNLSNKGDKKYLGELIQIIQFRISKRILLTNSMINPQLFKNVVGAAIKLSKTNWVKNFIRRYEKYLPEEFRSDYYNLAAGQVFYHEKKYVDASRRLAIASHNKNDIYFGFAVKKLLLKIGYESNDLALESYIESYRKHLERNRKKIGEAAPILEKFYKYFQMLADEDSDSEEMEILLSKLLAEENFADKDWLIRMTNKKLKQPVSSRPFQKSVLMVHR